MYGRSSCSQTIGLGYLPQGFMHPESVCIGSCVTAFELDDFIDFLKIILSKGCCRVFPSCSLQFTTVDKLGNNLSLPNEESTGDT